MRVVSAEYGIEAVVVGPEKNARSRDRAFGGNGAGEEVRTLDVHLGKVVLYQLSYAREKGMSDYETDLPAVN